MEILTPEEVAGILKIKASAVYELTRKRCASPIPFLRIAGKLRFNRARVMEWLQQQEAA